MKRIAFVGGALGALREFPPDARREAGYQSSGVQRGLTPDDWKPMPTIGAGVREIRVRDERGAFRVVYIATIGDRIHVLHAFQKKTQQTAKRDVDLCVSRLRQISEG
jgi:phage-related protein